MLECEQHPAPDLQRILERLQPGRERAPLVVTEIGVGRTGGENQEVVAHLAVRQDYPSPVDVHAAQFREQYFDVGLPPENPPDRGGDVARGERRACHLVEERLENVIIPAVQDGDADRSPTERAGRVEAPEPAAGDDYVGTHMTILARRHP